jgi:hypothetical protein
MTYRDGVFPSHSPPRGDGPALRGDKLFRAKRQLQLSARQAYLSIFKQSMSSASHRGGCRRQARGRRRTTKRAMKATTHSEMAAKPVRPTTLTQVGTGSFGCPRVGSPAAHGYGKLLMMTPR